MVRPKERERGFGALPSRIHGSSFLIITIMGTVPYIYLEVCENLAVNPKRLRRFRKRVANISSSSKEVDNKQFIAFWQHYNFFLPVHSLHIHRHSRSWLLS